MKKIISLLIAVLLISITVFAAVPSLPIVHDFEGSEFSATNINTTFGYRYVSGKFRLKWNNGLAMYAAQTPLAYEEDGNRSIRLGGPNVDGGIYFQFTPFTYNSAEETQSKKLVISYSLNYLTRANTTDPIRYGIMGLFDMPVADFTGWDELAEGATTQTANPVNGTGETFSNPISMPASNILLETALNYSDKSFAYNSSTGWKTSTTTELNSRINADIAAGKPINYKFIFDLTRDVNGFGSYVVYANGVPSETFKFRLPNVSEIDCFGINGQRFYMLFDNLKIYTVDSDAVSFVENDMTETSNVSVLTSEILLTYDGYLTESANQYITVKKNGNPLVYGTDYEIELIPDAESAYFSKSFKVKFINSLNYDSTYVIEASDEFYGENGVPTGSLVELASFSTESVPAVTLSNVTLKSGFNGTTPITSLAGMNGKVVTVSADITNQDTRLINASVCYKVYKNDVLKGIAFASKSFVSGDSDTFKASIRIPDGTASDDIKLEVLVCEGIANLTPYTPAMTFSTAE